MATLDRSNKQKIITSSALMALFAAIGIFVVLMVLASTKLSNVTTAATQSVNFGPLKLLELHKAPVHGGYQVSMQLLSGFFFYLLFWVLAACAIVYARLGKLSPPKKQD